GETATTQPTAGSGSDSGPTSTGAASTDTDETTADGTDGTTDGVSSETETATVVASESAPSVEGWVDAWSDESDLLVIGDGLSNMPSQWVQLWARQVGRDRPVQLHHWGERSDVSFN